MCGLLPRRFVSAHLSSMSYTDTLQERAVSKGGPRGRSGQMPRDAP
jgi:hypothetical protein